MGSHIARVHRRNTDGESQLEILDELSDQNLETLKKNLSKIEEHINRRRLIEFVETNELELRNYHEKTLKDFLHKSISWDGFKRSDNEIAFIETNRFFLNYLSSFRTFHDHTETFLKRAYGNESPQVKLFKDVTKMLFDNSFPYRFFYKLRNYAQHVGLPINSINFQAKYSKSLKPFEIEGTFRFGFDRDKLLATFTEWGPVKFDLVQMNPIFDAPPLISEMSHNVREIERNVFSILKEELLLSAEFVNEMFSRYRSENCEVVIASVNFVNIEVVNFEITHIPHTHVEDILTQNF